MGELDLLARVRGAPDQRRTRRRRRWPAPHVRRRPRRLPRSEPRHCARAERNRTARRSFPPGHRRGAHPSLDALDRERDLPWARAGDRVRDLGLDDRRHGRARPARRRLVRDPPELALGVLRQPADRTARARGRVPLRRREPRSGRATRVRPARRRALDAGLPRDRLRADRGADVRLVDGEAGRSSAWRRSGTR